MGHHYPQKRIFLHHMQENKVAYNFWENLQKTHSIEFKRVVAWRQTEVAGSLHYVTETKHVNGFIGTPPRNGCN